MEWIPAEDWEGSVEKKTEKEAESNYNNNGIEGIMKYVKDNW